MRYLRLLAIFTSLALNSHAQWHTNAPYIAWPATNHLRWVNNVGVYTNFPNWQTNGYGLWTNNLLVTNVFILGDSWWFDPAEMPYFPYPADEGFATSTNVILNAKDIRALDCINGLCERYLAANPDKAASNFWSSALPLDEVTYYYRYRIWRDERKIIASLKGAIKGTYFPSLLEKFYYGIPTNSTPTNWVQFTESNLCSLAGVPTNFLTYTPHRAADMSHVVSNSYYRIMTNTFTLRQGTNATHWATNNLVDSAGNEFFIMGSNGMIVTRYATNEQIEAGHNITEYGWDGLKRVINLMTATIAQQEWGIGEGTNWDTSYLSNFPSVTVGDFSAGSIGDTLDNSVFISAVEGAFAIPYGNLADDWMWKFSDALSSGVTLCKTNIAPYAHASVVWRAGIQIRYIWNLSGGLTRVGGVDPWYLAGTGMVYQNDANSYFTHVRSNSVSWNNYAVPIVIQVSTTIPFTATALHYVKTNGTTTFFASNTVTSVINTHTSEFYRITQPELSGNFGVNIRGSSSASLSLYDPVIYTYPLLPNIADYALWYLCGSWTSNTLSGADLYGVQSASTNWTLPTVTKDKTILLWDFRYK